MNIIIKHFFCCLNSKKTKFIELILLVIHFLCLILYIIFFKTISWTFIHIIYKLLIYLTLLFLLIGIIINIYFIYIRKKKQINSKLNNIAITLAILIILICVISIIINYYSTYNILFQFKKLNEQKIVFNLSKNNNIISIISIIVIDIIWAIILFIWFADFIRIKIRIEDTFYNYLKTKSFKKNFYLFKEEFNKESKENLKREENNKNISNKIDEIKSQSLKYSANNQLIEDNNNSNITNLNIKENSITLNISNLNNTNNSNISSSLSDSFQKPVDMVIIGADEKGNPIYAKQNSFDKSQRSNDSDSFSNKDKKFDQSNYIQFNDITLNNEDTLNEIDNYKIEKKFILEKENEEIKPKIINENEKYDYKENFVPLQNFENEKDIDNEKDIETKDIDEQKTKINV